LSSTNGGKPELLSLLLLVHLSAKTRRWRCGDSG
jgi:hypothetical protein